MLLDPGELRWHAMRLLACCDEMEHALSQLRQAVEILSAMSGTDELDQCRQEIEMMVNTLRREIRITQDLAEEIPETGAHLRAEEEILSQFLLDEGGGLF